VRNFQVRKGCLPLPVFRKIGNCRQVEFIGETKSMTAVKMWILMSMSFLLSTLLCSALQKGIPHNSKRTWSPPDGSFTVELPLKLEEVTGEYQESDDGYKSIRFFASSEADSSYGAFEVVILELANSGKLEMQPKLSGLQSLIGGGDQKPT
jgi:hypothetical protein